MSTLDLDAITAIDVHTHAEVSRQGHASLRPALLGASAEYFKAHGHRQPTIDEIADHYRERKMLAVVFTVDAEHFGEDGARLLRLVSKPEFLALKPRYGPENPCCDFFIYTVTVTYDGGHTKTVRTSEVAEDTPEILWNVILLTERIGSSAVS